jgi:hypothetical protein
VKRTLTILMVAIVSFVLGAGCMYLVKRQPKAPTSDGWIATTVSDFPIGYALDYPIGTEPTPKATALTGKVKFLTRDSGTQLGYLLKIPIEPVPTKSLPIKDQKEEKLPNGFTIGPPDQLHLEGQFDFILKDADGFELQRISAVQQNIAAGADNDRQGIAEGVIQPSVQERTKKVEVSFTVKSCYPCNK